MEKICNVYGDIEMSTEWDANERCYFTRSTIIDAKTHSRRETAVYPTFNKTAAMELHRRKCLELNKMMLSLPCIDGEPYACNQED